MFQGILICNLEPTLKLQRKECKLEIVSKINKRTSRKVIEGGRKG